MKIEIKIEKTHESLRYGVPSEEYITHKSHNFSPWCFRDISRNDNSSDLKKIVGLKYLTMLNFI